jgi:hypothetical protein
MIKQSQKTVIVFTIVVLIIGGGFIISQYHDNIFPPKNTSQEVSRLVSDVGKLMILPTNEVPTIASVADVELLRNQPFFHLAENGDKVLIYNQAKKAILYRQKIHKIIEVAPVNVTPSSQSAQTIPVNSASASITPIPTIKK